MAHVMSEREVMSKCNHPFLLHMAASYQVWPQRQCTRSGYAMHTQCTRSAHACVWPRAIRYHNGGASVQYCAQAPQQQT